MSNWKDESRRDWSRKPEPTMEDLQVGCLQRIADATEAMAKNHVELVRARDNFERWYRQEKASNERLSRSNAALRGVIKRMKRAK